MSSALRLSWLNEVGVEAGGELRFDLQKIVGQHKYTNLTACGRLVLLGPKDHAFRFARVCIVFLV